MNLKKADLIGMDMYLKTYWMTRVISLTSAGTNLELLGQFAISDKFNSLPDKIN